MSGWTPTFSLRWRVQTIKDGLYRREVTRVLQQRWVFVVAGGDVKTITKEEWRDVPCVEFAVPERDKP